MQKVLHKSDTRGSANHGWLQSKHTFSFANYFNPSRMGFGVLRVINDDIVSPAKGFGTHPHRDMEIISVPLKGSLYHKDTIGNEFVIRKGEIQVMSAGSGISHSEFNHSKSEEVNFLQIWVEPKLKGIDPSYSQKDFPEEDRKNQFQLIVSPQGEGAVKIHQDAYFSLANFEDSFSAVYKKNLKSNGVYIFVISGQLEVDGQNIDTRDGFGIREQDDIEIKALNSSEFLVMEVPLSND
ncbi:MAG: pirin family protein [Bdellovibrionota bacterium]|nr:pirin family protein [Bdellovibrionota bacterium]